MRYITLILFITFTSNLFGQFGPTDYHLSGPGYIYQIPCQDPVVASCGDIHTYTIVDESCNPINMSTCSVSFKWQIRDSQSASNYFLSHNGLGNWSQHFGAVLQLPTSNLRLTVYDINCSSITLKIEILDNTIPGDAEVFGLSASTSVGNIGVVDTDCSVDEVIEPSNCDFTPKFTSCNGLSCLSVENSSKNPCNGCYCMQVNFDDNTSTSFTFNFDEFNTIMKCFDKEIDSSNPYSNLTEVDCTSCGKGSVIKLRNEEKVLTKEKSITIAPNPVDNYLRFIDDEGLSNKTTIFDFTGNVIGNYDIKDNKEINVSTLKKGLYIATVYDQAGAVIQSIKFIKQ